MPHVVVQGPSALEPIFSALEEMAEKREDGILKTQTAYLAQDQRSIVVEALAIEGGEKRAFFALMSQREDGLVVRLHPTTEVEKTWGVKRILAALAEQVLGMDASFQVGETNLRAQLTGS